MKLYLYLFVVCFSLCACKGKTIQQVTLENQKHRFDSIYSLVEKEYFIERDSFSEGIPETVYPKNKPNSLQKDYLWSYFEINNDKAEKFRLVIQNSEEKKIDGTIMFKFNIDGKIVDIIIQSYMAHESYKGNYYDIPSAYAVEFLESLRNGSRVKMQAANLDEYTTRTITSEEINNIIKTYQYYQELGGELDSPDVPTNQDN
ncbi:hypothetical protein [Prevotella pallens]|uniref:hypothetical protein n=1 Tax=Prevotella pallens TaxID=60133 RepID=UPI00352E241A